MPLLPYQSSPFIDPPVANQTALVATTAEALWLATQFSPIFANEPKAGRVHHITAGGILSTGASGTLVLIPQYGAIGGTTLGTSQTITVPINLVGVPWVLELWTTFRTIGGAGANSTAIAHGYFGSAGAASAPGAGVSFWFPIGGVSAAVDATINAGITISKTLSVAGSITVQTAFGHWMS